MKKMVTSLVITTFIQVTISFSQFSRLDSLWKEKNAHDTTKVQDVLNQGIQIQNQSLDSAHFFYSKAIEMADEAITRHTSSTQVTRTLLILKAISLRSIGIIHYYQGSYDKAIEHYLNSLKISEELGDKKGMSSCYNNIGLVHQEHGSYEKAIEYYLKCIKLREELGDKKTVATTYINIGNVNRRQKKYGNAIEYFLKSLKIAEEFGDKKGISSCFNNIGLVYNEQGNYDLAIEYYLKSLKLKDEIGDKNGSLSTLINIGSLKSSLANSAELSQNQKLRHLNDAVDYGERAYALSLELKAKLRVNQASSTLMDAYKKLGNYKKAFEFAEAYISTKDSMFSEEKTKILEEMQAKYEAEKKQQEIEKQKLIIEKQEINFRRQRIQRNFFVVGSMLLGLLVLFIFRGYLQKNRSNIIISEKNTLLEQANEEIKVTSEALASQNEMLKMQNEEITKHRTKIENQRDNLSLLNAELQQKNEEITTQRDELERTQQQLIQSEKMASIGLLTAGIAHEINNPINFVYAGVNSLIRDFMDIEHMLQEIENISNDDDDSIKTINRIVQLKEERQFNVTYQAIIQTINDIRIGAERTTEIVEGLKNFSQIESEEWNKTDLNKLIDGVLILLKNKYRDFIEIVKIFDNNIPLVECNRSKINQVIMNLLSNAIDSIKGEGQIVITTRQFENECVISIKDTGKGITDETLNKIFDPFFTTKEVGKGVGLGLSIAYGIIQEHQGFIGVNSKPEVGTEFIVKLPITQNKKRKI